MGVIFGAVSAAPLLLVFAGTRERPELMRQAQPKLRESLRSVVGNRPFLFGLGIYLATWVAIDIMQATLLFFLKYVVQREAESDLILASIFVSAMLTLPVWSAVAGRFGKRRAYIGGIIFWGVVQIVIVSLAPATPLWVLLSLCVLAGVGVGAAHVLPWAILPDAVEWDEWRTGKRHEGVYYSFVTLAKKVTSSIAIPLALLLLHATDYVPNAATQSRGSLMVIRMLTGPIPALLLVLGVLCAAFYPLTRSRHAEICRVIAARRVQSRNAGPTENEQ
jgi:GPH family glycoside/pentoside/hexuronide:cation symporter